MSKIGKMKSLQIIIVVIAAAALVGVYTMNGDKSFDEMSESAATNDTAAVETADSYLETENFFELDEEDTEVEKSSDKSTDSERSSDTDSDTSTYKNTDSDTNTDTTDTDKNSDSDITSSDEDSEAATGTIFPYRGVWNLIIVNKDNPIPESYDFTLTELDNGKKVDSRIYDDLQEMLNDMTAVGIYPVIGEAYRTAEEQEEIMQNYISDYIAQGYSEEDAKAEAKKWVAKPGTSEHQLGLALDINADTNYSSNEAVYNWLADNAYKYGFILRYPQGKEDITGIDYEPWHYRYVGKIAAEEIYNSGVCLEEYLTE